MAMGRHVERLLKFAIQYPGWNAYGHERSTVEALNILAGKGMVELDREKRRFRLAMPARVWDAVDKAEAHAQLATAHAIGAKRKGAYASPRMDDAKPNTRKES